MQSFLIGLKKNRALGYKFGGLNSDLESGTDRLCDPEQVTYPI